MDDLTIEVAASLDAQPEWTPILPALLGNLPALGGDPEQVSRLLADLPRGARVLDLGCGTGGVSLPLARAGATVEGVDAFEPFVVEARERAAAAGLEQRCTYVHGEVRAHAAGARDLNAVLLVGVGLVFGGLDDTARALAATLAPGGLLVFDWEDEPDTRAAFEGAGLVLLAEERDSPERVRAHERDLIARIRANAAALVARAPRWRAACDEYLAAQEAAAETNATERPSSTWLFERPA